MGNIVGKQFGVVASKNYTTALAESIKEGNQAKFYLAQSNDDQKALGDVTEVTSTDRNALIINGNTIQGISKEDITKLDAISDVTKIFKYQGSVRTRADLLAKVPPFVEKGDVYNVETSIVLNGIPYSAHTNFVYTGLNTTMGSEENWDSLGGTLQIGTSVKGVKIGTNTIRWGNEDKIPISSLTLKVTGGLLVSSNEVIKVDIGTGLKFQGNIIALKLSTKSLETLANYEGTGVSGLNIDDNGGLHVALAPSSNNGGRYLVHKSEGIALDYAQLVTSLKADTQLKTYINSLIDAKLKAQ